MSPFVVLLAHVTSLETFEAPSLEAWKWMLLNGAFGTVVSNFLWGLAVVLLNPVVATIGTNLEIPLVILVDTGVLREHT